MLGGGPYLVERGTVQYNTITWDFQRLSVERDKSQPSGLDNSRILLPLILRFALIPQVRFSRIILEDKNCTPQ